MTRLEKLEKAIKIYQKCTQISETKSNGIIYFDIAGKWGTQLSLDEVKLLKELQNE